MLINVKSHSYHSIIFVHSWLQIKKIRFDKKNSSQIFANLQVDENWDIRRLGKRRLHLKKQKKSLGRFFEGDQVLKTALIFFACWWRRRCQMQNLTVISLVSCLAVNVIRPVATAPTWTGTFLIERFFWFGCGGGLVVGSSGDPGFDSGFLQTFSFRILQSKIVYYQHAQLIWI